MEEQLYLEDVYIGMEVKTLVKVATTQMLVKWAGATGDFNPLHYDDSVASDWGMGSRIVHGQLKRAWLVQMLADWIGENGWLCHLSCRFKQPDYPRFMKGLEESKDGESWYCKGAVKSISINNANPRVECDIWIENGSGEITTVGNATVTLPSRLERGEQK